jgi:hypothetical protein
MSIDAGRELDAMVAEKVMELRVFRDCGFQGNHVIVDGGEIIIGEVPRYSEDIAAAWQVVEKIETHGWYVGVGWCNGKYGPEKRGWCYIGGHGDDGAHVGGANAATAPHAICLAGLKACGINID